MSKPDADTGTARRMLCGGLTLEQYAEVVAHLLHFSARDPSEVLARFQLDEASFRVVECGFRIALVEETIKFRTSSLKVFAKGVKGARRKLEDEQPELDAVGTAMGGAASDSSSSSETSSDEPAIEEAAIAEADPAEAMAAPDRAPDMPTYVIAAAKAAWAPPSSVGLPSSAPRPDQVNPPAIVVEPALVAPPAPPAPPALVVESADSPQPGPPAVDSDDGKGTQTASEPDLHRLETVTFEAPPSEAQLPVGVLPFLAAAKSDAPATAATALDPEIHVPTLTRTRTVFSHAPLAHKALPLERSETMEMDAPELVAGAPGGLTMSVEQYASFCAEILVDPTRSSEIEKRYGLFDNARHELDATYRERFAKDAALQAKFEQLTQRFRAWLEKSVTT